MQTPICKKRKLGLNELGQICWHRMGDPFDSPGNNRLIDGSPISDTSRNVKKEKKNGTPIGVGIINDPNLTPPP